MTSGTLNWRREIRVLTAAVRVGSAAGKPSRPMEAMEVDSPVDMLEGSSVHFEDVAPADEAEDSNAPHAISESGSSTEVDEDEDDNESRAALRTPPRLPATWAFSQRAVSGTAAVSPSWGAQRAAVRRRIRYPFPDLLSNF
ncbi:hypothetical protein LDENG_00209500 [Lucifuga dentata]|nr:hypothetical protein LDENG_00209500 [Lucifuga dentata]